MVGFWALFQAADAHFALHPHMTESRNRKQALMTLRALVPL